MMLRWIVFVLILPFAAFADGAPLVSATLRAQILERPARFEAAVAAMILGYGSAQGINAQGLADYLAVERAKVRVRALRQMLLADLDDDGAVSPREVVVVVATERSTARRRLWQAYNSADTNGDGTVSAEEMLTMARAAATQAAARHAGFQDLMGLDFDGNGFVTLVELRQAIALPPPET